MPLIGGEELQDDEYDLLPTDLQYLSAEKQREPVVSIRRSLLEALYQVGKIGNFLD